MTSHTAYICLIDVNVLAPPYVASQDNKAYAVSAAVPLVSHLAVMQAWHSVLGSFTFWGVAS